MTGETHSFEPPRELTGHERVIAAMGPILFKYEQGPNAHVPEDDAEAPEHAGDALIFVETVSVKEGVKCDVYKFLDDDTRDLGIVTVKKGYKTPLQRVLHGDRTIEGFLSGAGKLTVVRQEGTTVQLSFPNTDEENEVVVLVGDTMQWEATEDLVFYEICEPPYEEGRFKTLNKVAKYEH